MTPTIGIENIEAMRQQEGIDDIELHDEIKALKPGDHVRLTISSEPKFHGSVLVRLTQVRGWTFRGKLVTKASRLPAGSIVSFTSAHIHSIVKTPTSK